MQNSSDKRHKYLNMTFPLFLHIRMYIPHLWPSNCTEGIQIVLDSDVKNV